ncbi:MAG: T9SS type A sorting domain-containing protein [Chlorobi bacterium]|nr:T9SS type A sorting domain-containing protein [Chlorobiota bacterium]
MRDIIVLLLLSFAMTAQAQVVDTLAYDEMQNVYDGMTLAVITNFPGESDAVYNARFSPAEKCWIKAVQVGFGQVKFQPLSGPDTLEILVYDADENTKPWFKNVVKTYRAILGDQGFPAPNMNSGDPLTQAKRGVLTKTLNPPIPIAPKRDFLIGVKMRSRQRMIINEGVWRGFHLAIKPNVAEFNRYRRYQITLDLAGTKNTLATEKLYVSLYIRAIVEYAPDLQDTILVSVEDQAQPRSIALSPLFPNPVDRSRSVSGPGVSIVYSLTNDTRVRLTLYDMLGRKVATLREGAMEQGQHVVTVNTTDLAPGQYMVVLSTPEKSLTRKLVVTR